MQNARLCAGRTRLAGSSGPFVLAAQRLRAPLCPHDISSPHERLRDYLDFGRALPSLARSAARTSPARFEV